RQHLRKHKQRDQPAPDEQLELDIMPQRHKSEHHEYIEDRLRFPPTAAAVSDPATPEGDIDVPHDPSIEAAVPTAPEG
ncbi:MAG: hypothetical protein Q9224_006740, partial [Gallowayella concinna]